MDFASKVRSAIVAGRLWNTGLCSFPLLYMCGTILEIFFLLLADHKQICKLSLFIIFSRWNSGLRNILPWLVNFHLTLNYHQLIDRQIPKAHTFCILLIVCFSLSLPFPLTLIELSFFRVLLIPLVLSQRAFQFNLYRKENRL